MAINTNEATLGSLPERLGELGAIIALMNTHWETGGTYHTAFRNAEESYVGALTETGDIAKEHDLVQELWKLFEAGQQAMEQIGLGLRAIAQETARRHINRDTGQFESVSGPGGSQPIAVFYGGLGSLMQPVNQELARQLEDPPGTAPSVTVQQCAVTATATAGATNTGNGAVLLSVLRGDGKNNPFLLATKGRFRCVVSGQDDLYHKYHEIIRYTEATGPSKMHPDWGEGNRGRGGSYDFLVVDPTAWCERGNELANGNLDTFTSNVPHRWTKVTGTAGSDFRAGSTVYFSRTSDGRTVSNSFEFIAGTGILTEFKQAFNSDAGSSQEWQGNWPYGGIVRLRAAGTITGGVLQIRITNSSGTTLTDDQGASLVKEITLSTIGSGSWTDTTFQFNTPKNIPDDAEVRFNLKSGNPLTGANLFMASLALGKGWRPYAGSWFCWFFAGSTAFVSATAANIGDYWDVTATNDHGGASHRRGTYQLLGQAFLDTDEHDVVWPETSGTAAADWNDATGIA